MKTLSCPEAYLLAIAATGIVLAALPVLFVMHNVARVSLPTGNWVRA